MFWNRFSDLCSTNNIKPNTVAKELGISSAVITHWKKTGSYPTMERLFKIADYFDCSIDYLVERSDEYKSPKNEILFDDYALLEKFHSLDQASRDEITSFIDFKIDLLKKKKELYSNSINENPA